MKIIMKHDYLKVFTLLFLIIGVALSDNNLEQDLNLPKNGPIEMNTNFTPNIYSSFLTLNENLEEKSEEMSKLSSFMKSMMLAQQSNRRKKRYTDDGRLCASAFAQDGQTFFDCTSTRSPDGQNKNKEWCYVDASAKGSKPWDYCKPIMDYDKIREENQNQLKQFTIEARKVQTEIEAQIGPGQQALDDLKKVRQGQAELDAKINELIKEISTLNNNMQNLYNTKDQWEKEEEKAVDIAAKSEKRRDKLLEEQANNKPTEMDKSEDTIKKETAATRAIISPFIQQRLLSTTVDCNGMLGYEEDARGDGIIGQYFDNESFLGEYKEQKDPNIDFDWTGASAVEGINPSNFSVRWEGFIYAPITSNYQFAIECDDGATITINNQIVVSHNMFSASEESKARVDKWLKTEVEKRNNPSKNYSKSISTPIKLTGGTKFKIVVSYYHSVHDDITDDEKSYVKLYWQSDDFEERIISKEYLYTQNSYSPLKLSGFSQEVGIVRKLLENDLAFKNSDKYIIQDIPVDYRGSSCIKLNFKYMEKELKFNSNIPVIVFLGRLAHYPNPIPNDFENTGEFMTLLQINKPSSSTSNPKKIEGSRSALIKIYKKKFQAGKITIPLNQKSINIKGIPLIVFFGFDSQTSSPLSCGGQEMWISNPNSEHFKGCTESSYYMANWRCSNGLNGHNKDKEGSMWAAKREGIGSWINIEFKNLYQVSKLVYYNRRNPSERNSEILATFSNGEEFKMSLKNVDDRQEFMIDPPILTISVKFTIKEVYGTINNGGSFLIYGTKCIDADDIDKQPSLEARGLEKVAGVNPKSLPPLFNNQESKPIILNCKDSLSNTKKLDHIKQKAGNKVKVRCQENCGTSKGPIYGDLKYSKDSAICKAAYHSQKLKTTGGLVEIVFEAGQSTYKGAVRNGIKSKSKGRSDITISFESADEKDEIIVQNGSKVDIRHENRWQPGVITQIKETNQNKVLTIIIEGEESAKPIEITYPNKSKVKPCGDQVRNRDCKGSRLSPNTSRPIKIKFVPSSYNKPGDYLLDKGETFGKSGKAYGWSKDISNRIKERTGGNKPELDTLVEFPPSPNSKFCNKPTPDVPCDKVSWSVKVGHGKFSVKLYVGDTQANTRVDLKVNDRYIVEGKTIPKGQLEIFEGAYDSINEFITISSDCISDCEYAMSKLNMVEIYPFQEEAKKEEEPTPEQKDPCGNGFSGGRCDKGPDVTHCIFDDPSVEGAKYCTGNLLMVQVSKQYRCTSQRDKFKCVKRQYKDHTECIEYCPGKCDKAMCL